MAKKNGTNNGNGKNNKAKSMESWIWDAACSIRGAKDAPKFKDFILPLIFLKRLCDVFDDEINRISSEANISRTLSFELVAKDKKLVRFYLPIIPNSPENEEVWDTVRKLSDKIGQQLTDTMHEIGKEHPRLNGIIDRVDFNATTHGLRDIDDDRLSNLIEKISEKRLGLEDVEPDIIGRSYEYLIRKFAEGSGQSAGEFYTPKEVGMLMAKIMDPEPGMTVYDPCCGSSGLLIKCQLELLEKAKIATERLAPLHMYGQESTPTTWAMANMNMIIHDMEGEIEIGDTMRFPKFKERGKLKKFDIVVTNPMWNQPDFKEDVYDNDEYDRFPQNAGFPGNKADWGWMQHVLASLKEDNGKATIVLDTGAATRGSGNASSNKEKDVRKYFVDEDLIEGVIYLPENLFYNTSAPGIILILNKNKGSDKKNKLFLINASKEFLKGDPKNYIPDEGVEKITRAFLNWEEIEKFAKIVEKDEIIKQDYNISPSRYIHVADDERYRPISEIVEKLKELNEEAKQIDDELDDIFKKLGV